MFIARWALIILLGVALSGPLGAAWAQGNVVFQPDTPAVSQESPSNSSKAAALAQGKQSPTVSTDTLPGNNRAIFPPVTPEESEQAIHSRTIPTDLNQTIIKQGAPSGVKTSSTTMGITIEAAPTGPASIVELARALRNDPDLIYEYVRNNIEYYPIWGVQKGAVGALLDNQGTAFDQAALMIALLRQSGYPASYVMGQIHLTAAQVNEWLGVETVDACAVCNLLSEGDVPFDTVMATQSSTCQSSSPPVALISMNISHVWVKVNIGGTNYYFDPSYKPHTLKTGIDLVAATGYNASSYLTAAKTGATFTGDYVQGINRANIRTNLTTYATNLTNYLRSNKPAATLTDVVGGMTIKPHTGGNLRQTSLPYQNNSAGLTEWTTDIPDAYRPYLRIQYQRIDKTYTSDAIYGKRLSITNNALNKPELMLDGVLQDTGLAITPGLNASVTFTVTHGAYATHHSYTFTQTVKAGGTFIIGNGWGPTGRGLIELHRTRLAEAKAAGSADTSEVVLGSTLALLSATWIAQVNQADYINDRLAKTTTLFHHQIGIAGYDRAAYVDLPGNLLSVANQNFDNNKESAAFFNASMHSSIFESAAVQQITKVSAVSTVKLIDIAAINNDRIYNATSTNYTSVVQPNLVTTCNAPQLSKFLATVNDGRRLILPTRCNLTEASWSGTGYFTIKDSDSSMGLGAIISGGLAGGYSSSTQLATQMVENGQNTSVSSDSLTQSTGAVFGEPIDMANGYYLYDHNDITTGVGEFPMSLNFKRLYSSGRRTQDGPLGRGWTHNLAASVTMGSDGFQGLGEDSGLDAAGSIVEMMISLDLLSSDRAMPLDKMVIATLGQSWYGDQLLNNTVIVRQGLNGEVFVKLPDGSYNAPPGNPAKLSKNINNTYTYETLNRAKLNFNSAGKIATYVHPGGVQVYYGYTNNDLTQVQNSLRRSLTLTNTAGRVTQIFDGARYVNYSYDASGNLDTFTDATAKMTSFKYDLPGRMTQFFYPSNPTIAFITNVYDSLSRVQTQTNANGNLYSYYFAGSRSEEVTPGNISRVSYLNALGKVVKAIDPLKHITTQIYDGQSRLASTVLPEGNSVTYAYDDAPCAAQKRCTHNVKTVRRVPKPGSGLPTLSNSYTYESNFNQVESATDPRGQVTTYTYTPQGNPLMVTSPADFNGLQPRTIYEYGQFVSIYPYLHPFLLQKSETRKIDSTKSVVTATTYNPANKYVPATTVVDAGTGTLNLTTSYTYDDIGNLLKVNGPRTDVIDTVTYAYDAERRVIQTTDALGKFTRQAYDADGRLVRSSTQIGPQWLVSCRSYTPTGKLLKSWGPGQTSLYSDCPTAAAPVAVTSYAYDNLDRQIRVAANLTTTEGGNRNSGTVYNADDSVQSVTRDYMVAEGTAEKVIFAAYTYTTNGLPATVKDAKNNLTTYQYDGHDRKVKTLYPDKVTTNTSSATDYEQYDYDGNSNLWHIWKRNGQTVTLGYDNLNRLISRYYTLPIASGRAFVYGTEDVVFGYDLLDRRISASFVKASRSGGPGTYYEWDNAGRLKSTSASASGMTIAFEYDPAGNRIKTTWPEFTPFYVTTSYDELNRPRIIKELGTTTLATYDYDDLSRRKTMTRGNASTTTSYNYTAQSALYSLGHDLTGTAQDITYTYPTRNQVGEIVSQNWNNDIYQWNGAVNSSTTYSANGLNQYTKAGTASPHSDSNGNLTSDGVWSYSYDSENRLRDASKSGMRATLVYDAEGRMQRTTLGTNVTNLLYDGTNLVAEYNSVGTLLRRYVYGPGLDEPLVWYEGSGTANKSWLYNDHQGSIIATANSAGTSTATYTYGPYGEPNTTNGLRFRYTGQQLIGELGLYHYKARFYSPTLGRFLQTDPIGYKDDMNLYAYAQNNPVNGIDPEGLFTIVVNDPGGRNGPTYGGTITVTGNNGQSATVAGSSWPNPTNPSPGIASGTYDAVYSPTGHQGTSPGVRLENGSAIPTLGPNPAQNNQSFATGVNIHGGYSSTCRGSAGCITIAPGQANKVWDVLQPGETGTVSVNRTNSQCGR